MLLRKDEHTKVCPRPPAPQWALLHPTIPVCCSKPKAADTKSNTCRVLEVSRTGEAGQGKATRSGEDAEACRVHALGEDPSREARVCR